MQPSLGHDGFVSSSHSPERGQATVEWLAIVIVAGTIAVLLATAAPDFARRISCGVEQQVANVTGDSTGCGSTEPGTGAGRAEPEPRLTPYGAPDRPRTANPRTTRSKTANPATTASKRKVKRTALVRYGFFGDALGALLDILEGPPPYIEIDGFLVRVEQNGPRPPVAAIRKLFGVSSAAFTKAEKAAKRLGVPTEALLAGQKVTASLVDDMAKALPGATRRRVTLAVGVGKDSKGRLKIIAGSSETNGYMRPAVRKLLEKRKIEVAKGSPGQTLSGHAERQILEHMRRQGLKPVTIGASRPICRVCASAIRRAGGTFATRLKPPRRPTSRPTRPG